LIHHCFITFAQFRLGRDRLYGSEIRVRGKNVSIEECGYGGRERVIADKTRKISVNPHYPYPPRYINTRADPKSALNLEPGATIKSECSNILKQSPSSAADRTG
jgi:hypothetical protein